MSPAKRPKQTQQSPHSPPKRVGGGYDIEYLLESSTSPAAAAQAAAASVGKLLTGLEGPLTEQDLLIVKHILKTAQATAVEDFQSGRCTSNPRISLARLLQAYDAVLPQHGLVPQEDTHYYRILLKLTLDPSNDWWQRFHKEQKLWSKKPAKSGSKRRSPAGRAGASAAKWHSATSSKARSRPAARSGSTAAGLGPAAVQAAAVAVDAATAAVAAAWADARGRCRSRTAAAKVASPHASAVLGTGANLQESFSLESWQGVQAQPSACCTWLSSHDTVLSDAAGAAVNAACAAACQAQEEGCSAGAAALQQASYPDIVHSSSCWHSSPVAPRPRAASAGSMRSSCCDAAEGIQQQQHLAAAQLAAQLRSRSTSPGTGLRRSSSCHLHPGAHRPSSSGSGVVHEYPCAAGCAGAACTCGGDAVARVYPVRRHSPAPRPGSPVAGDALAHAVLEAGQRDRLWKCLELHSAAAAKLALQQQQQGAGRSAAAAEARLQAELSAGQLSDLRLQRYSTFVSFMSVQHNWRARALAARTSRDPAVAAEHYWTLAMSFWEVHAAWRCFVWWQQLAAAAVQASNQQRRHWLLLCSFQWWRRMALHYQRQQPGVAGQQTNSTMQQPQQQQARQLLAGDASRPSSPLAGLTRLLQKHPNLRPPCSPAAEMRQQTCGRVLAAYAFAAWLGVAQQKAAQKELQLHLTWHHVQHVQAAVWNKWRREFEQVNPKYKLMRAVYRARRISTLSKVIKRWRVWAPVKHAQRRHLRDAVMTLHRNTRRRVWNCMREYTAKRRIVRAAKQRAFQHFRVKCLLKFISCWLHALDIAAAFEELADACYEKLLTRRAQVMLLWWQQWVQDRQQQQELLEHSCCHMEAYTAHRCLAVWHGRVLRKLQLWDLLQQGLLMSKQLAAQTAFRGWHERCVQRRRFASIEEVVAAACQQRKVTAAWLHWLEYVARRQQQHRNLEELTQRNQEYVWRRHLTAWRGLLHQKLHLFQAFATLQNNLACRCVHYWKAWVDKKADWRSFQARATQHLTVVRMAAVVRLWATAAGQQAMLRTLLAGFLQRHQLRIQQKAFGCWRNYLLARVAKRMNQLSALLQWEQSITRRALRVWVGRTAVWRYKRQQRLRADSYHALRLLDLALTGWSSVWAESQELAQKAAFYLAGKQGELKVQVLRAWGPEAARQRLKREHLEIARLHSVVTRQEKVLAVWHAEAALRVHLRELLGSAVLRWSQLSVSRAFEKWKDWALRQASLQRRMRTVMSRLMGRTLHWAFYMMREHALRKRRTRSARHHWQRTVAAAALGAWRQLASDAAMFRGVLADVGQRMQAGLLSEAFHGWQDVLQAKQWKAAAMMRALMQWGGNRRHLCFQTWRQWVQLKQGKKVFLRQALKHWQHSYLTRALGFWRYHTQRKQVARQVLQHFHTRYLAAAFGAWRRWYQRKAYLAAVFAQLQGKGHHQVLQVVWNAWHSFVPQAQVKRHAKGKASAHWHRRALILTFAWWHEYAVVMKARRRQLADALLRWDSRRMWLALDGWRAVTSHRQTKQQKLAQGAARRRHLVLATAFRGWREETQLQLYRRHVVVVLSHKVNNGTLLKAFNCWRDVAEAKQARRQQLATALTSWWLTTQRRAFDTWRDNVLEAIKAAAHWQHRVLSGCLTSWRERVLVKQQYSIITRVVTNKRVNRLLLDAWTAWREVIDLRHQVTGRLRVVAQGWDQHQLWSSLDAWRQWTLLKHLGRLAVQRWETKQKASCWSAWRLWALQQRTAAAKISGFRSASDRKLGSAVLREWARLSWLLPREQRAGAFAATWLLKRSLLGWRSWLMQKRKWELLGDSLAARWTNLHLTAAWQAWRAWVQGRQEKARLEHTVARRWNNLHLAAAFQAWVELVQVSHRHKAAVQTIAGRWRNLHTAAAFGAWRSFVATRRHHKAAASAVAVRWQNLHLAAAFGCWRQAVAKAAERAAAADAMASRQATITMAAAFLEWRQAAARKAQLRRQESVVSGRQQRLYKELAYGGWKEAVQWCASKRAADAHWRQVVQRSLLAFWHAHAQRKAGYEQAAAVARSRTRQQLLRSSMSSWQVFVKHQQQKATADTYAGSRLQQRVFLAWVEEACQARSKANAAVNMAARVQARVHNQLLFECFAAWRTQSQQAAAFKSMVLGFSTKRLRTYLLAWQQQAHMLAGAARLLRRLLAVTVEGAFQEWRTVARERAHWHRVEQHISNFLRMDDSGAAARATRAVLHWQNPTLAAAFSTWRDAAAAQLTDRTNELKAAKFLQLALVLKALTGFKWAVQEASVDRAAAGHRGAAVKRAVLKGWRQVAWYLQEKQQKQVAAAYAWSSRTKHKALTALLSYSTFRRTRVQQTIAARHHWAVTRKAGVMSTWQGLARYLAPIRAALDVMTSRRRHHSKRQLFAGWRLVCHRSALLQMALGRLAQRTLAVTFLSWRGIASLKHRRRSLLHAAVGRISHLQLARAFTRWVEAAQELKTLRAKAHQVLRNTLRRRMRNALASWEAYVEYCEAKRAKLALAERHWRQLYRRHGMAAWSAFVKKARRFAALAEQMLMQRQQKQRQHMLHWWHLVAQDLHHHRAVLESFRARHVREEGVAIFAFWKDWAHWRGLERRAIVAYWHKIMLLSFATWKQHHEDLQVEKAVSHDYRRHSARALVAWQLGMALIHRKRSLIAAAAQMVKKHRQQHSLSAWMRYTYYKHIGHVALHFRVRRLACVVLREWQEAAVLRVVERETAQLLTHQLAVNCATRVLTGWQQMLRANTHWRQHTLRGCLTYWSWWAPDHRARNAGWRAAAQELAARKLARCFYCWRWYCQVRLLREVAFQNKQRAIREALAIGEQVARRRKAALLASCFMAWHIQVSKYRAVAQKLAGLLQRNLTTCFRSWREATDHARVSMLRAQRQHATRTLRKLLPAWLDTAAECREQREAAEASADKLQRRWLLSKACCGWVEELQIVQEQRQGLWQLMLMLLGHERQQLLHEALGEWRGWVCDRVNLRATVSVFVNKRRLGCLADFLTLWQQYAAAMRGGNADEAAAATVLQVLTPPPPPRTRSPGTASPTSAGQCTWPGLAQAGSPGYASISASVPRSCSPAAPAAAAAAVRVPRSVSPPGLLPVTGGPGSPLLGPRSAQQDRRLARRIAAMGGGAAEVDVGSDEEQQLFEGLPTTEAALSAAEWQARQQPLLALSKGHRQRRVTLGDDQQQYNDEAAAAAGGVPSPRWDLHSVAESMQQAHLMGLSPWQLPSVRTSPTPKPPHADSLTLEQLRSYQQQYPYSLREQWQQQQHQQQVLQQERQHLLQVSQQQPVGRPGSAGVRCDYQPLLQQQLELQEQLLQQQRDAPLPWQQHGQHSSSPGQQYSQQGQREYVAVAGEPWHTGKPRWQSHAAASAATRLHWAEKRAAGKTALIPADNSSDSGSSSSPSTASAMAGSVAEKGARQQQHGTDLRKSIDWAAKAMRPLSPQAAAVAESSSPVKRASGSRPQLPSFNGQVLPKHLAALVGQKGAPRHTA